MFFMPCRGETGPVTGLSIVGVTNERVGSDMSQSKMGQTNMDQI